MWLPKRDLGAEKFFDIKCRVGGLKPSAAVLVITRQALEVHGYENIAKHIENIRLFGVPLVIAVNKKENDPENEIKYIVKQIEKFGVPCVISDVHNKGGRGGADLAKTIIKLSNGKSKFKLLYGNNESLEDKINKIATQIYGVDGVDYTDQARNDLELLGSIKLTDLPVCIAKTQYSLSDNPKVFGRPKGFKITINSLKPSAGAGFVVVYTGSILTMPGLPKHPAAENMDITEDGKIKGLF